MQYVIKKQYFETKVNSENLELYAYQLLSFFIIQFRRIDRGLSWVMLKTNRKFTNTRRTKYKPQQLCITNHLGHDGEFRDDEFHGHET